MKFYAKIISLILAVVVTLASISCGAKTSNVVFQLDKAVEISVSTGSAIPESKLPATNKKGYTFKGWQLGNEEFDLSTKITKDITLTPVYEANKYTVSFENLTQTISVTYDSPIGELPEIPKKVGYIGNWVINGVAINKDTIWRLTENATFTIDYQFAIALDVYGGEEIDVKAAAVKRYLALSDEGEVAEYLYNYQKSYVQASAPSSIDFSWDSVSKGKFTVQFSQDKNFEEIIYQTKTYAKEVEVYNLIPGEYYWKVVLEDGTESEVDTFTVTGSVRQIYCGNIVNMRDEGGWVGEFGKIKYGKAFRSTDISSANSTGIDVLVNQLGLKTQIDLRTDKTVSAPHSSITYVKAGIWQNDMIFPNFNPGRPFSQTYADNLKVAFKLFADESNYPILFHCTAGADRTGTFAYLLNGLCGVYYEDLVKDFEITSFYQHKRWRSGITVNGNVYTFNADGVMQDNSGNLVAFGKMHNQMMNAYGTGDGKLSSAIANYLKTVVGLTDAEITAIRTNMIENYNNN